MDGYLSENETTNYHQMGGKTKKLKTIRQLAMAKGRRDAKQMINIAETLPNEVQESGFHYNLENSREVLEESRELGNQTDNSYEYDTDTEFESDYEPDYEPDYKPSNGHSFDNKFKSNSGVNLNYESNTYDMQTNTASIGANYPNFTKSRQVSYRVIANKRRGGKPKIQIRGLELNYDNTQSPFINATYLDNGNIVEGILNEASAQIAKLPNAPGKQRKLLRKRNTTIKKKLNNTKLNNTK